MKASKPQQKHRKDMTYEEKQIAFPTKVFVKGGLVRFAPRRRERSDTMFRRVKKMTLTKQSYAVLSLCPSGWRVPDKRQEYRKQLDVGEIGIVLDPNPTYDRSFYDWSNNCGIIVLINNVILSIQAKHLAPVGSVFDKDFKEEKE